jgi:NADH-quinone oxidoreductase subunit J
MMADWLFYLFAALALVCGFLVVANPFNRNPVTSAMFLVLTMVWLAGLFVLLHAFFLAAVQILVYAGAVMVLFLFVIMFLNPKEESPKRKRRVRLTLASLAVAGTAAIVIARLHRALNGAAFPELVNEGSTASLGRLLFKDYLLPFEVVSILLLVAMVGTVILSKKERT